MFKEITDQQFVKSIWRNVFLKSQTIWVFKLIKIQSAKHVAENYANHPEKITKEIVEMSE